MVAFSKTTSNINDVKTSFYIDLNNYLIFKNKNFLTFVYKIRFFILKIRKFKEFKNSEKVLIKSKFLGKLIVIPNIII